MQDDEPIETPAQDEAAEPSTDAPAARLIVKRQGAETDVVFEIHPPATLGRFDASVGPIDIDLGGLPEGSYVSRRHAEIIFDGGTWTLRDLGSSNGTFVLKSDFERIEEAPLEDGTEFALGNARFVFRLA